jgi:rhamnogalacturonyl hydrolase YesR
MGLILSLGAVNCGSPSVETEPKSTANIQAEGIFSVAAIQDVTNGVTDWQLAHMELAEYGAFVPSFQERSEEKRGWIQGTFLKGMADWALETDNEDYFKFLKAFAEKQDYQLEARIYHADDHVVGQYYAALYDRYNDLEMIKPTLQVFDQILDNPSDVSLEFGPKGTEAGYSHECLKRWCWADALFMGPPVWTKLSKITNDPKYLAFSDEEFWITKDYLFDDAAGLFLRDSRFFDRREENGEKIYWSRGNGWVFAGLTDIIDDLPKDHPSYDRYVALYKQMAASLIALQDDSGYWPVSLAAGDLYPVAESSGTAFFVAGLSWGLANNMLDKAAYLPSVKRGWRALNAAINDQGMLGWVQQVGYAPDRVSPNETQFYGNGAFLLAGAGVHELSEKGFFDKPAGGQ